MAISGTSNYEIEVPCLVAKGLFGCGFSKVFKYLARNTQIFRHLPGQHLVLEQLRTKPSLFGIRGYKGSLGLTYLDNIQSSASILARDAGAVQQKGRRTQALV